MVKRRVAQCRGCPFTVTTVWADTWWANDGSAKWVGGQMARHKFECPGWRARMSYAWDWL